MSSNSKSIQYLKGVGPARLNLFSKLGVESVEDLFYLFPKRYEDRRRMTTLAKVKLGEMQAITGKILVRGGRRSWQSKKHLYETALDDGTGRIHAVWFNQPYLEKYFKVGQQVVLYGKVERYKNRIQMVSPEYELISDGDESLNINRIVPIYPLTKGISQRYLRKIIHLALEGYLDEVPEILPPDIRKQYNLASIHRSLSEIHFPDSEEEKTVALRRVSFEEFFIFQLSILRRRMALVTKNGFAHSLQPRHGEGVNLPEGKLTNAAISDRGNCHSRADSSSEDEEKQRSNFNEIATLLDPPGVGQATLNDNGAQGNREEFEKIRLSFMELFEKSLPFVLTSDQRKVMNEILSDMQHQRPMLRLLQGDVGSGKTLVALSACIAAARSDQQAAFMAPTEILARQHYENIRMTLDKGPFKDLTVELLVSGLTAKQREKILERLKSGKIDIVVGTHALLSEEIEIPKLSLVVIDEQHKFGVRQRALLSAKGRHPDVLVMTATPIPRTLSLTLFGDLEVSTLNELPPGRGEVFTKLFSHDHARRAYDLIKEAVKRSEQAFVVYPIVEESEKLDLKAAQEMYKTFCNSVFKGYTVGLVHGKMKRTEAEDIMKRFKAGKIQILVATTILEVGVDIPNATVMVIEHAERFGLAQLHQLRGRIGRGGRDGQCLLIADPNTEEGISRLNAMLETNDGFEIAKRDLMIRGPGHYFGRHQHGLNELRFADPSTQIDILEQARNEAGDLIRKDPDLKKGQNKILNIVMNSRYPGYLKMIEAG